MAWPCTHKELPALEATAVLPFVLAVGFRFAVVRRIAHRLSYAEKSFFSMLFAVCLTSADIVMVGQTPQRIISVSLDGALRAPSHTSFVSALCGALPPC